MTLLVVLEAMQALEIKHQPTFLADYLRPALRTG
jgi:hypothetical protein